MKRIQIGKLTVSTVKGKPERAKIEEKPVFCCRVYGKASNVKHVEDKVTGEVYRALTGIFEAENYLSDVFVSELMYFPGGSHDMHVNTVLEIIKEDSRNILTFAVELWAIPAKNPSGYSYEIRDMADIGQIDPLADLKETVRKAIQIENTSTKHLKIASNKIIDV